MAFKAKSGRKRTYCVVRTLLHISIDRLVPVADLISPNLRSSGFPGKPGQEFSPKIAYFWRSKMFLQVCTVGLGYKNSASHVCMIENFKFDHGFCNNFCNNWAKIWQCAICLCELRHFWISKCYWFYLKGFLSSNFILSLQKTMNQRLVSIWTANRRHTSAEINPN